MIVREANKDDLPNLALLLDAYRIFYHQPSDINSATDFLKARFTNGDSIVFIALDENNITLADVNGGYFKELMEMLAAKEVNSRVAKDLLLELHALAESPRAVVESRGLGQVSDTGELRTIMEKVIAENESVAAEYRGGKEAAANFLVGQGMKATKGSADPAALREIIAEILK